jgi:hypothetical protein
VGQDGRIDDPASPGRPLKITTLPNVEISPKLSDQFLQQIDRAVSIIPESVLKALEQHGDSLKLSPQLKDLLPELSGKPIPGDPSGRVFDQSPGLYYRREKSIIIFEYVMDTHPPFRVIKNNRAPGILRHELGHALDRALGGRSDYDDFQRAYNQDVDTIDNVSMIDEYAYYLTRKGRSELFAELFAVLQGGGADERIGNIKRIFPATLKALQTILEKKP